AAPGVDIVVVRVALQIGILGQDRHEVEGPAEVGGPWRQLEGRHDGDGRVEGVDLPVSAEDEVVARARGNDVVAGPAQDDIAAGAVGDAVGAVGARRDGDKGSDLEGVRGERGVGVVAGEGNELAAVAEDDALAVARSDRVGARPAEEDVVAGTGGDDVVAAGVDVYRVGGIRGVVGPGGAATQREQVA